MNNRYNELSNDQQQMFDSMINSVASHKNTIGDSLTIKTYWSFHQLVEELWVNRCDNCQEDMIENDVCGYEGHNLAKLFDGHDEDDAPFRCCKCLADLTGVDCEVSA